MVTITSDAWARRNGIRRVTETRHAYVNGDRSSDSTRWGYIEYDRRGNQLVTGRFTKSGSGSPMYVREYDDENRAYVGLGDSALWGWVWQPGVP